MIDTEARGGFRLDEEPAKLRDAYGRNRFGQGCLLARRLLERGVSFVEVTLDGWDTHANNFEQVKNLSQTLDPAFSTLLADLKDRGMLANTLVVWMGEFGRTPKMHPGGGRPPGRRPARAVGPGRVGPRRGPVARPRAAPHPAEGHHRRQVAAGRPPRLPGPPLQGAGHRQERQAQPRRVRAVAADHLPA